MKKYYLLLLLIILAAVILLISCGRKPKDEKIVGRIKVVATIGMITDIVKEVGGEEAEVYGLMGPGVDPHLYKATPSDVLAMSEADIIFYNGLHLEAKMSELFEKMSSRKTTVAVSKSIPETDLRSTEGFSGMHDPHIWFDVVLWQKAVIEVGKSLSEKLPAKKEYFEKNMEIYLQKLDSLNEYVKKRSAELPAGQRVLITAHDAFGYFGKRYGFDVIGLQGISTQAEAGTNDVQSLVNIFVGRKIKAVFIESSVPKKNIYAVQEAVAAKGWQVDVGGELFSDAMGDKGSFEGTYIGMITHNINTIVDALSGKHNGEK